MAVSGGLAAVVLSDVDLLALVSPPSGEQEPTNEDRALMKVFAEPCSSVAVGLDLNPECDLLIELRFTHDSISNAKVMLENLEKLRELMITDGPNVLLQGDDPADLAEAELLKACIKQASFETQSYDDSSCDLIIKSEFPLVDFAQLP